MSNYKLKVSISGSRHYNDYNYFKSIMDYYKPYISHINVGDAKGIDSLTVKYCQNNNIPYNIFVANWDMYGKAAGPNRNADIIKNTELLIAFPLQDSKGTKDTMNKANNMGIPVHVYQL